MAVAPHASAPPIERELQQAERIAVLDVLRGIALLGMFFVHSSDASIEPSGGFGLAYRRFVELFFSTQFYTMFAILPIPAPFCCWSHALDGCGVSASSRSRAGWR